MDSKHVPFAAEAEVRLRAFTRRTVISPAALREELERVWWRLAEIWPFQTRLLAAAAVGQMP
ncbi:MAG: hypothetical protein QN194_14880 [Armatimonadota bacterium]|nr:hypothetical protein [Armatimonadota bacterium]